jgi:hypothetical protein
MIPPSTFSTSAADGPQNPHATEYPSNYEICDRTGFKVPRGTLKKEWTGAMVRPESWESRHPADFRRGIPERPRGSPRPEAPDVFITEQIQVSDL